MLPAPSCSLTILSKDRQGTDRVIRHVEEPLQEKGE